MDTLLEGTDECVVYVYRLELYPDSGSTKPELVFMDSIDEVVPELVTIKNEQTVIVKMKDCSKLVITNTVRDFWGLIRMIYV